LNIELRFGHLNFSVVASTEPVPVHGGYVMDTCEIAILHPYGGAAFYRHGWNSWSPTGWRLLTEEPLRIYDNADRLLTADDSSRDLPGQHAGSVVGALDAADGNVLLLGALSLGGGRVVADSRVLRGDYENTSGEWFVGFGRENDIFARYSALLKQRFGATSAASRRVWSSWYSSFEDVSEFRMDQILDGLRGYPFDVVQLDDGWQESVGDWVPNAKFPSGMRAFADRTLAAGFEAGLWLAPFICIPDSAVAIEHPDWLLKDVCGEPVVAGYNWGKHYYTFDTTLSEVRVHLRDLFRGFFDAGYRYFKLDFMYAAALPGVRSTDIAREDAYRDAIELIRQAVGPSTYLLGSGVPMLASIGIFDGVRVGPDVAPYWDNSERHKDPSGPGALNSLVNSMNRVWMRDLYHLDPDVVFFRSRQNLLDRASRQALIDIATVLDFKSTSDPVDWLDENERVQLRQFLSGSSRVVRRGRFAFDIDDRHVDFSEFISTTGRISDRLLVK